MIIIAWRKKRQALTKIKTQLNKTKVETVSNWLRHTGGT